VAQHERGWWVDTGIGTGPLVDDGGRGAWGAWIEASVNPGTRAIAGSVGFMAEVAAAATDRDPQPLEPVLLYQPYGGGIGMHLRWRPGSWAWLGRRGAVFADYRHGSLSGYDWKDVELTFNQWTVGIEPTATLRIFPRVAVDFFAHGGAGLHVEGVMEKGDEPRFGEDHVAAAALTGGVGLALTLACAEDLSAKHGLVSLRLGYDGWVPFRHAEVSRDTDSAEYMKPDATLVFGVGLMLAW
jgi:hypothetical protein